MINSAKFSHNLEIKQRQRKLYRLSIVWNAGKCLRNEINKGSSKSILFSQISALVKETAVGNPVMECAYGLFPLPLHSEQVQWLFDFYVFGVQEVSQTLMSNFLPSDFTSVSPV